LDPNASSFGESISDTRKFGVHKYKMGDMKTYQSWDFTLNCNWKAFVDNAMEYYHVPWVHPITFQANTPLRIWKDMPHISDQDFILMIGQKPGASYSSTGEP